MKYPFFLLSPGEMITVMALAILIAALAVVLTVLIDLCQYDKEDEILYEDD